METKDSDSIRQLDKVKMRISQYQDLIDKLNKEISEFQPKID